MEQQPIMGKIEQLTNVPDYHSGQPHSQRFSKEPYRISNHFGCVPTNPNKTTIEIEIDAGDAPYDTIRETLKKICEDHDGKHELHIKIARTCW